VREFLNNLDRYAWALIVAGWKKLRSVRIPTDKERFKHKAWPEKPFEVTTSDISNKPGEFIEVHDVSTGPNKWIPVDDPNKWVSISHTIPGDIRAIGEETEMTFVLREHQKCCCECGEAIKTRYPGLFQPCAHCDAYICSVACFGEHDEVRCAELKAAEKVENDVDDYLSDRPSPQ